MEGMREPEVIPLPQLPHHEAVKSKISFSVGQRSFEFKVWCRCLLIAKNMRVHYCWLDHRQLNPRENMRLWRDVIDVFWEATLEACLDESDRREMEMVRILVELQPVIQQRLGDRYFHSALLGKPSSNMYVPIDAAKLKQVQANGGVSEKEYRQALDTLGESIRVPDGSQILGQELYGYGMAALKAGGKEWNIFRERVGQRLRKERNRPVRKDKHGKLDQKAKDFLSLLATESKMAFMTCYVRTWAYLLPALHKAYPLSCESHNFMGLWHYQQKHFKRHVFALHPISAIIMNEPYLLGLLEPYLLEPQSKGGGRMLTACIALAMRAYAEMRAQEIARPRKREVLMDPTILDPQGQGQHENGSDLDTEI